MKILGNYRFLGGLMGGEAPKAKDGVFLSRRLIFRVGGQNEEK
jgi:hypothetical protein